MEVIASFLVFGAVFYLLMRLGCGGRMVHGYHHGGASDGESVDPVCGMKIDPGKSYSLAREGSRVHFCSLDCLQRFERNPEAFSGDGSRAAQRTGGTR